MLTRLLLVSPEMKYLLINLLFHVKLFSSHLFFLAYIVVEQTQGDAVYFYFATSRLILDLKIVEIASSSFQ